MSNQPQPIPITAGYVPVMLAGRTHRLVLAAALMHVLLLGGLAHGVFRPLFNDAYNRAGPGADFFGVYFAGERIAAGQNPYERPFDAAIEYYPFRYPPLVAQTLGRALTVMPPTAAYCVWIVLLEALLILCLRSLRSLFHSRELADLNAAAWLLSTPYVLELWMGQFTFLCAALVFLAVLAWQRGARRLAASLWLTALVVKLFPLALTPWLARRQRKLLALGVLALCASMAWFIDRPIAFTHFAEVNFAPVDIKSFHSGNFGMQAALYRLLALAARPSDALWLVVVRVWSLVLVSTAALSMLAARGDDRVSAAMALMLLPLINKHVWEHHYVVAMPAFTLLAAAWSDSRPRLGGLAIVAALILLPSPIWLLQDGPAVYNPEPAWAPLTRLMYHAVKPTALLTAFVWAAKHQLTPRTAAQLAVTDG